MKGSLLELEEDVRKASAHCAGDGETRPPESGSGWLVGERAAGPFGRMRHTSELVWVGL